MQAHLAQKPPAEVLVVADFALVLLAERDLRVLQVVPQPAVQVKHLPVLGHGIFHDVCGNGLCPAVGRLAAQLVFSVMPSGNEVVKPLQLRLYLLGVHLCAIVLHQLFRRCRNGLFVRADRFAALGLLFPVIPAFPQAAVFPQHGLVVPQLLPQHPVLLRQRRRALVHRPRFQGVGAVSSVSASSLSGFSCIISSVCSRSSLGVAFRCSIM